ncbi:MAG: hypothetical protein ACPHK8_03665 [Thermoplasmatota archaeon]
MKQILALALIFMVASASAQISTDPDTTVIVEPGASASIPFTYTGSCQGAVGETLTDILLGGGEVDVTITGSGGDGLTFTDAVVTLDYTSCVTGPATNPSATGSMTVTADQWASGRIPQDVTLTDGDATATASVMTNYTVIYALTTDATFPMETNDGKGMFNVTLTVTANAPTMIMFFTEDAACGSVTGMKDIYNINAGDFVNGEPTTITSQVTYENTCGEESDSHSFNTVAHNPEMSTDLFPFQSFAWTFTNADGHGGDHDDEKDTPGFGLVALLGAIAVAFVARRK